ncbi:hypothetical protein L2E82_26694 [Cichorium intybus]|uniref:Uncharacterized protein n=1 Tax=Cichorium intybus TaxID=13427 RepID=A0ACB9CR12_CICIN|nr:hypothetical protein L2E82_26694 [Cichorium intybus]
MIGFARVQKSLDYLDVCARNGCKSLVVSAKSKTENAARGTINYTIYTEKERERNCAWGQGWQCGIMDERSVLDGMTTYFTPPSTVILCFKVRFMELFDGGGGGGGEILGRVEKPSFGLVEETTLPDLFPRLFALDKNPNCFIANQPMLIGSPVDGQSYENVVKGMSGSESCLHVKIHY